jgi:cytochrome b6-f complex iron-sulfur subunit
MEVPRKKGRRSFINWFLGTSAGAVAASIVYPLVRFASPPDVPEATTNQVEAGSVSDPELLQKGFKIVRFGADPVILLRLSETDYRAFEATCTHLACTVEYQPGENRLFCNCHNGVFDLTGRNVSGPPPKPLESYRVDLVARSSGDRTIVISRA